FRNEYDEFADRSERRLSAIDRAGGRLEVAENLITQTANGLSLKADQTTVNEIEGTLATLGTEFEIVSGQVSNKVWQTDIESAIDDLDIGTMNLITDSHFYDNKRDSGWRAIY